MVYGLIGNLRIYLEDVDRYIKKILSIKSDLIIYLTQGSKISIKFLILRILNVFENSTQIKKVIK